jgi:hypothetical protein
MLTVKEPPSGSKKNFRSKKISPESTLQKHHSLPPTSGISKFEMGNLLSKLPDNNFRGSSQRSNGESKIELNLRWKDYSDLDIFHTQAYPELDQEGTVVVLSQINLCYNSYHDFCHEKESYERHSDIFDEQHTLKYEQMSNSLCSKAPDTTRGLTDEENTELQMVIQGLIEKEDLAWEIHQAKMEDEQKILGRTA